MTKNTVCIKVTCDDTIGDDPKLIYEGDDMKVAIAYFKAALLEGAPGAMLEETRRTHKVSTGVDQSGMVVWQPEPKPEPEIEAAA